MPKAHDKCNVLELSPERLAAYRRYLVSRGLANRLMQYVPVMEALENAGISGL